MNKTITFLGILLLFILLAGGVYFFVLREAPVGNDRGSVFTPGGEDVSIPKDDSTDFVIDNTPTTSKVKTTLTQIHASPVAGAKVRTSEIDVTVGSTTETVRSQFVQYVDKQTGHVFSYDVEENDSIRISNTTFPGIQNVSWFEDENNLVLRYVNGNGEIETYLGELDGSSLTGSYFDVDIPTIKTFGDSLLNVSVTDRGSEGYAVSSSGRGNDFVFESNLTNILIPFFSETFTAVLTKPVSTLAGVLYFYENGSQARILGDIRGLTALPNQTGDLTIFSESSDRGFASAIYNREDNSVRSLPLAAFPEKCIWHDEDVLYCMVPEIIPPAHYPEHWYQGLVSFTDSLWRIDASVGSARAIAFFDESGPFDGTELSLDADGEYITFINRRDGSLWGFNL